MSKTRLQSLVEMHMREQTKLEMDENVFTILNELLENDFGAVLQVTRASVGDKIVAVMKARNE